MLDARNLQLHRNAPPSDFASQPSEPGPQETMGMVDVGKLHIIGAIEWGVVHMNEGWNYAIKSYQIHMSWTSPCCGS
jgi:hypothetical protein